MPTSFKITTFNPLGCYYVYYLPLHTTELPHSFCLCLGGKHSALDHPKFYSHAVTGTQQGNLCLYSFSQSKPPQLN